MDYPTVPPATETETPVAPSMEQAAPPAGPAQAFVPYHNEIYRFSLRRVGADWHPAMRLTLVLGSVLLLGAVMVVSAWGYAFWHVAP